MGERQRPGVRALPSLTAGRAGRPGRRAGIWAGWRFARSGVLPELIDLAGGPQNVVTLADFDGAKQHEVRFSNLRDRAAGRG
jgi:hypothetical protein